MAATASQADHLLHRRSGSSAERASTDPPRSPSSGHTPFLHNLSQRFRKGSNASSNTSDSRDQAGDKSNEVSNSTASAKQAERARANASRAAKRYLMTIVRNDWEYPPTSDLNNNARPDAKEATTWRLRDAGSDEEHDLAHATSPNKRRSKSDPYRFENPDAVAEYVNERAVKRRKILYEQMRWNQGLRHWVHQRDAWTGAVWQHPQHQTRQDSAEVREAKQNTLGLILEKGDIPDSASTTATSFDDSVHSSAPEPQTTTTTTPAPRYVPGTTVADSPSGGDTSNTNTSESSLEQTTTVTTVTTTTTTTDPNVNTPGTSTRPSTTSTTANEPPDPQLPGPYVPLYPPLFPSDNVLRSRIQPAAYSAIYSKIVVQCLTPNIPIPLTDMVRALVAGWKEEGQWPPQGTTGLPPGAQGSGKRLSTGGGAFARWRRERRAAKDAERNGVVDVGALEAGDGDEETRRGSQGRVRVRNSLSKVVKKAMGKEDQEVRRRSEVGLTVGFEEEDLGPGEGEGQAEGVEEEAGDGEGGVYDADRRLNERLLG